MEIVINRCYGAFGLSGEDWKYLAKFGIGIPTPFWESYEARTSPILVACIRELGYAAGANNSQLEIVNVLEPYWTIVNHYGLERIIASNSPITFYY